MRTRLLHAFVAATIALLAPCLEASDLSLSNAGSEVDLEVSQRDELAHRLEAYFRSCHPYDHVVRNDLPPQEELTALWRKQAQLLHAVLHLSETMDVLFGFSADGGASPVLSRDGTGNVRSYVKCPGLEGLLLSCYVMPLVPGMKPSSRCSEWERLGATHSDAPAKQ
jgi:hypothetical protein